MALSTAELLLVIRARDEARREVAKLRRELTEAREEAIKSASGMEQQAKATQKATRAATLFNRAGAGTVRTLRRISSAAQALRGPLLLAGGAILAAAGYVVNAASNQNEAISKSTEVFGEHQRAIEAFARDAAGSFGLAKAQVFEYASTLGVIIKGSGETQKAAADMSLEILKLSADVASFNNLSIGDALQKLRSGLVGETEPLRSIGVLLNEAAVKAKAYEVGIAQVGETLTNAQKVQARYALILEQTKDSQGDFARTSEEVANSQRSLTAQMQDISATMGTTLLPTMKELLGEASRGSTRFGEWFAENEESIQSFVTGSIGALKSFWNNISSGARTVWPELRAAFEYIKTNRPLIIAAIVAIGAAITAAFGPVGAAAAALGLILTLLGTQQNEWERLADATEENIYTRMIPAIKDLQKEARKALEGEGDRDPIAQISKGIGTGLTLGLSGDSASRESLKYLATFGLAGSTQSQRVEAAKLVADIQDILRPLGEDVPKFVKEYVEGVIDGTVTLKDLQRAVDLFTTELDDASGEYASATQTLRHLNRLDPAAITSLNEMFFQTAGVALRGPTRVPTPAFDPLAAIDRASQQRDYREEMAKTAEEAAKAKAEQEAYTKSLEAFNERVQEASEQALAVARLLGDDDMAESQRQLNAYYTQYQAQLKDLYPKVDELTRNTWAMAAATKQLAEDTKLSEQAERELAAARALVTDAGQAANLRNTLLGDASALEAFNLAQSKLSGFLSEIQRLYPELSLAEQETLAWRYSMESATEEIRKQAEADEKLAEASKRAAEALANVIASIETSRRGAVAGALLRGDTRALDIHQRAAGLVDEYAISLRQLYPDMAKAEVAALAWSEAQKQANTEAQQAANAERQRIAAEQAAARAAEQASAARARAQQRLNRAWAGLTREQLNAWKEGRQAVELQRDEVMALARDLQRAFGLDLPTAIENAIDHMLRGARELEQQARATEEAMSGIEKALRDQEIAAFLQGGNLVQQQATSAAIRAATLATADRLIQVFGLNRAEALTQAFQHESRLQSDVDRFRSGDHGVVIHQHIQGSVLTQDDVEQMGVSGVRKEIRAGGFRGLIS